MPLLGTDKDFSGRVGMRFGRLYEYAPQKIELDNYTLYRIEKNAHIMG